MTRPSNDMGQPAVRKSESPDKARWMLWLPHKTLAALKTESDSTGEPMAQIVRDATDARVGLRPEQVAAYRAEASRLGVPVASVLRDALVDGCPPEVASAA